MNSDKKLRTCEICNKTFSAQKTLNQHLMTHTGVKPHVWKFVIGDFQRKDT